MDLLQQHMDARGLSKRARHEVMQSLQVPKPAPKLPQPIPTQPRLSRKSVDCILEETGGYERDQYRPTAPILDAEARRREEQLLAEHGRKGLAAMRRLEAEQAAAKRRQRDNPAATPQPDLATQLVSELDERAQFVERMAGVRHAGDAVRKVKLEMAQRMRDLEALGVAVPRDGLRGVGCGADPNAITERRL